MIERGLQPEWRDQSPDAEVMFCEQPCLAGRRHLLMLEEIKKELEGGVIIEVAKEEVKMLLKVFLVPKKGGEWRKVLDCTPLNVFCCDRRFKMEDQRLLVQILKRDMWGVSVDIKSAYHHVTVSPRLSPYLSFSYNSRFYQYRGMPFGIKMAPRVFSRIMHRCTVVIRHHWKVDVVQYIDDIWIGHMDVVYLRSVVPLIIQFLERLGWLINRKKSELTPARAFKFLGWNWDTRLMQVQLTKERRMKLRTAVEKTMRWAERAQVVRVRELASVIGQLSAARLQFSHASLYLAELNLVKTRTVKLLSWNGMVRMNRSVLTDLLWWKKVLSANVPASLLTPEIQGEVWTDASPLGWGAQAEWMTETGEKKELLSQGVWDNQWSSNKRELVAVQRALMFYARAQMTQHIKDWMVHSDNMTTVYNLNRYASARSLIPPMRRLMVFLTEMGMSVRAIHIRGVDNGKADSLSRLSRSGDYSLSASVLESATREMKVNITCDLFASRRNAKHNKYCTLAVNDKHSLARDAFSIRWKDLGLPLIHPPVPLLLRCVKRVRTERICAILVAPHWLGQPWSNALEMMTVKEVVLGLSQEVLQPGPQMIRNHDKLPPGTLMAYLVRGSMMRGN
jgi:hypothetical protein